VANDIKYKNTLIIIVIQNPIILVFKSNSGQQLSFASFVEAKSANLFPKKSSIILFYIEKNKYILQYNKFYLIIRISKHIK